MTDKEKPIQLVISHQGLARLLDVIDFVVEGEPAPEESLEYAKTLKDTIIINLLTKGS